MSQVLHVGCGGSRLKDMPAVFQDGSWTEVRLDIDARCNPDIVGSLTDMSAVPSGSVDAVYSSHNIEHLFAHEVPVALAEFLRVLVPGGFALVTCPDVQSLGPALAEGKLLEPLYESPGGPISPIDILFGHRASIARGMHYMAHRCAFTVQSLTNALTDVGFPQAIGLRKPQHFALWVLGVTTAVTEEDLRRTADRLFPNT